MLGKKWQVILAGTGGQGLVLAGVILAEAAILEEKQAVQTQTYGIQTRGGFSQAEVIIGKEPIYYPKCDAPDLVLALSQEAYDRYWKRVSQETIILYDQDQITAQREQDLGFPFEATAIDLGNERVINALALGAIIKKCPVVDKKSIASVFRERLPERIIPLNLEALDLGYQLDFSPKVQ